MDNLETMSMDELRALVEQNIAPAEQEQPRDEQGRFTKPDEDTPPVDKTEEEETVYQRIIDLGDGSGTQVFEGKTLEELVDKLATAQEHATRKIREQAQALKAPPAPKVEQPVRAPLTEQDRWLLSQRLLSEPEKVLEEYVDRSIAERVLPELKPIKELNRQAAIERTATEWVEAHPDYYASPKNGHKIETFLRTFGLDPNPENFSKAYEDLNESGLLEARPKETPTEPDEEAPVARRIVEPVAPTTVRRKVVGGLSTKRSAHVEPVASGPTEDELYKMPMDDLKQLMYKFQQS